MNTAFDNNRYVGRSRIELPPHVFAVAEAAYRAMRSEKENQCVIIRYAQSMNRQGYIC